MKGAQTLYKSCWVSATWQQSESGTEHGSQNEGSSVKVKRRMILISKGINGHWSSPKVFKVMLEVCFFFFFCTQYRWSLQTAHFKNTIFVSHKIFSEGRQTNAAFRKRLKKKNQVGIEITSNLNLTQERNDTKLSVEEERDSALRWRNDSF